MSRSLWAKPGATWVNRLFWPRSSTAPKGMPRRSTSKPKSAMAISSAHADLIRACSDLSDGGLALTAFEMAEAAGVGVEIDEADMAQLFGEDQARYLVACNFDQAEALMLAAGQANVPIRAVGKFGGDKLRLGDTEAPLAELSAQFRSAFEETVG